MLARWITALAAFDYEVEHRPGAKHANADGMSRRTCARPDCPDCVSESDEDSDSTRWPEWSTTTSCGIAGVQVAVGGAADEERPDPWLEGWSREDLHRPRRAPLQQEPVGMPLERMAVDIVGPLPRTKNDNLYIVVIVDYFTKWAEAFPIPDKQTYTVAEVVVTEVVSRLGTPLRLHSDQGGEFESRLFSAVCELLGVGKTRTAPYRPQSDGLVERLRSEEVV